MGPTCRPQMGPMNLTIRESIKAKGILSIFTILRMQKSSTLLSSSFIDLICELETTIVATIKGFTLTLIEVQNEALLPICWNHTAAENSLCQLSWQLNSYLISSLKHLSYDARWASSLAASVWNSVKKVVGPYTWISNHKHKTEVVCLGLADLREFPTLLAAIHLVECFADEGSGHTRKGDSSWRDLREWMIFISQQFHRELAAWPLKLDIEQPTANIVLNPCLQLVFISEHKFTSITAYTILNQRCPGSCCPSVCINSLRPSDTTWRQRSGSTLAQVMACCLTAPSHYLNQCWVIISEVQWHSY